MNQATNNSFNNSDDSVSHNLPEMMEMARNDLSDVLDPVVFTGLEVNESQAVSIFAENLSGLYRDKSMRADNADESVRYEQRARQWFEVSASNGNHRALVHLADEMAGNGDKREASIFYHRALESTFANFSKSDKQTFQFMCMTIQHLGKLDRDVAFKWIGRLLQETNDDMSMRGVLRILKKSIVEADESFEIDQPVSDDIPGVVVFHAVEDGNESDQKIALIPFKEMVGKKVPLAVCDNLGHIKEVLESEFPAFDKLIRQVMRLLTVSMNGNRVFKLDPILLTGPAGIGKTSFCNRLTELLNVPSVIIGLAGSTDNMELKGLSRVYNTSKPSTVISSIVRENIANPLFVLDEIDKTRQDSKNGSVTETLLQMLEPQNARHFYDEFLMGRVDLSHVSWIATANSTDHLPAPLLSRLTVIELEAPKDKTHYRAIVKRTTEDYLKTRGIDRRWLPEFSDREWELLESFFTNPRLVRKTTEHLIGELLSNPSLHHVH